jgi:hypothetical protein
MQEGNGCIFFSLKIAMQIHAKSGRFHFSIRRILEKQGVSEMCTYRP